ncbi:unnamed protein product [Rhizopus stolonifer]
MVVTKIFSGLALFTFIIQGVFAYLDILQIYGGLGVLDTQTSWCSFQMEFNTTFDNSSRVLSLMFPSDGSSSGQAQLKDASGQIQSCVSVDLKKTHKYKYAQVKVDDEYGNYTITPIFKKSCNFTKFKKVNCRNEKGKRCYIKSQSAKGSVYKGKAAGKSLC